MRYTMRPRLCAPWPGVGNEDGYLAAANMSWADNERGRGTHPPAPSAVEKPLAPKTPRPILKLVLRREDAPRHGDRSNIALPLKDEDGRIFGALSIYSGDTVVHAR